MTDEEILKRLEYIDSELLGFYDCWEDCKYNDYICYEDRMYILTNIRNLETTRNRLLYQHPHLLERVI